MPKDDDHISVEIMYHTMYNGRSRDPFVAFIMNEIANEPISDTRRRELAQEAAEYLGHKDINLSAARTWFEGQVELLNKGSLSTDKHELISKYKKNLLQLDILLKNPSDTPDAAGSPEQRRSKRQRKS